MKQFLSISAIITLSYLLSAFLPWWSIVMAPFAVGFVMSFNILPNIAIGFISICILWGLQSTMAYTTNAADLAPRIGDLFNGLSPILLIIISSIIGGLYGALAQLSGHLLAK